MLKRLLLRLKDKLQERYQFLVINHKTYAQERKFILSLGYFLLIILFPIFLAFLITTLLIFFTPIRELIPGYTDAELQRKTSFLVDKVQEMEQKIAQRDSIIKSFMKITEVQSASAEGGKPVVEPHSDDGHSHATELAKAPPPPKPDMNAINQAIMDYNLMTQKNLKPIHFKNPVDGYLTNGFNLEANHLAIDLVAVEGSVINAVAEGFVIFSDYTTATGHVIGIYHTNGFISFYKHNRVLFKKVGSYVYAGEPIAIIGNSGENSTGPHLHFELWQNGAPVDPQKFLNLRTY